MPDTSSGLIDSFGLKQSQGQCVVAPLPEKVCINNTKHVEKCVQKFALLKILSKGPFACLKSFFPTLRVFLHSNTDQDKEPT